MAGTAFLVLRKRSSFSVPNLNGGASIGFAMISPTISPSPPFTYNGLPTGATPETREQSYWLNVLAEETFFECRDLIKGTNRIVKDTQKILSAYPYNNPYIESLDSNDERVRNYTAAKIQFEREYETSLTNRSRILTNTRYLNQWLRRGTSIHDYEELYPETHDNEPERIAQKRVHLREVKSLLSDLQTDSRVFSEHKKKALSLQMKSESDLNKWK